jgi:hypothetical protein
MLQLTSRVYLSLANRPRAQFQNSYNQEQQPSLRTTLKLQGPVLPSCTSPRWAHLEQETPWIYFSYEPLNVRNRKNTTHELCTKTKFQHFVNKALGSAFKKLILSMPSLLQGLHTMSLTKSVPNGMKPRECKCTKLR